jgi:hypothetical protein
MMQLLAQGVPPTLIMDLVAPPDAAELYAEEGARTEWLVAHSPAASD